MDMRIGILDSDQSGFPNLCLMKLSAFHKSKGDTVTWYTTHDQFDRVYVSKIFTESPDLASAVEDAGNATEVLRGGSGYDLKNKLPYGIEHCTPDYSLYPDCNFAIGFLTRGCPRKNHAQSCGGFCITPDKDGCIPHKTADLSEFWTGQKEIYLLDQNLLACKEKFDLLKQLADSKARVNFAGGLDARYMTDEVIEAMRDIRVKDWHFAWDDPHEDLRPAFERIAKSGLCKTHPGVYVLTNFWSTHEEDLYRVNTLRGLGFEPYVMIYDKQKFVDRKGHLLPGVWDRYTDEQIYHFRICQIMQRWTANRILWKSAKTLDEYQNYQNFINGGWIRQRNKGRSTK